MKSRNFIAIFGMVKHYLDLHTHRPQEGSASRQIVNVSAHDVQFTDHPDGFSLGIHPWYLTAESMETQCRALERYAAGDRVKLIGECGFDRLRGPALPIQHRAFECQMELAVRLQKPVIIHCVRAFDQLLPYGKSHASRIPMIVHGFNRSPTLGFQLIRHGFLLSFGAAILKDNGGAAEMLRQISFPFFLETDASGIPIEVIYERAAFLRQDTVEMLEDTIFAAWKHIQLM